MALQVSKLPADPSSSTNSDPHASFAALMALAVDRLLASDLLPSWPGLTRPSTPRRLREEPGSAPNGARDAGTKRSYLAASLRSFSAPKNVGGRDEPDHDASRARILLRKNRKCVMHLSSPD